MLEGQEISFSLASFITKSVLRLRHQLLHYNTLDIRQAEFTPLEFVSQFGVINAHQMQDSRMEVVNAHRIDHRVVTDLVRFADGHAWFDASAGEPHREGSRMVVASEQLRSAAGFVHRRASEFAAPDDERVFEQVALFQLCQQSPDRLVSLAADAGQLTDDVRAD